MNAFHGIASKYKYNSAMVCVWIPKDIKNRVVEEINNELWFWNLTSLISALKRRRIDLYLFLTWKSKEYSRGAHGG